MTWKLQGVKLTFSDLNSDGKFGTNLNATFRMQYSASLVPGKFKEMPKLDWHETIMMNEHHNNETWVFDTNMYTHNAGSATLLIWPKRYFVAYDTAHGGGNFGKGASKLLAKNGSAVKAKDLAKAGNDKDKAEAVREYLRTKGGILEIEIWDIPCIRMPDAGVHKERVLLFNIGVIGSPHVKAYQYLDVDGDKPTSQWVRKHGMGWGVSGFKTTGMKKVSPPSDVTKGGAFTPSNGKFW